MNIELMHSRPDSREAFEKNLNLLCEIAKAGRLHIREGLSIDGLLRVRYLPNGRIDLLSVDESTRLKANTFAQMDGPGWGDAEQDFLSTETPQTKPAKKAAPAAGSPPNEGDRKRRKKKGRKKRRH